MLAHGFTVEIGRFDIREQLIRLKDIPVNSKSTGGPKINTQPSVLMRRDVGDVNQRVVPASAQLVTADEWWICQQQLELRADLRWTMDASNPQVLIPLFEYLLPDPAPEVLVHFGAQVAAIAMALLPQSRVATKFMLAVGNVFERADGKPGFSCWAGFAACFKKQ